MSGWSFSEHILLASAPDEESGTGDDCLDNNERCTSSQSGCKVTGLGSLCVQRFALGIS